jgi:hypothetical protein
MCCVLSRRAAFCPVPASAAKMGAAAVLGVAHVLVHFTLLLLACFLVDRQQVEWCQYTIH